MTVDPRLGSTDPLAQITQQLADMRRRLDSLERGSGVFSPWVQATLGGSFTHGVDPVRYSRSSIGAVQFTGFASYTDGSSLTQLMLLPVGFRPSATIYVPRIALFSGAAPLLRVLQIAPTGIVNVSTVSSEWGLSAVIYTEGLAFSGA